MWLRLSDVALVREQLQPGESTSLVIRKDGPASNIWNVTLEPIDPNRRTERYETPPGVMVCGRFSGEEAAHGAAIECARRHDLTVYNVEQQFNQDGQFITYEELPVRHIVFDKTRERE